MFGSSLKMGLLHSEWLCCVFVALLCVCVTFFNTKRVVKEVLNHLTSLLPRCGAISGAFAACQEKNAQNLFYFVFLNE